MKRHSMKHVVLPYYSNGIDTQKDSGYGCQGGNGGNEGWVEAQQRGKEQKSCEREVSTTFLNEPERCNSRERGRTVNKRSEILKERG